MRLRPRPEIALLLLAAAALAVSLFRQLGHPLLWQDEAETAMYATRILEHGYPVVHGPRNVVYEFGPDIALGVKEGVDAYIGTTWGHFYFAVPGVRWAAGAEDPHVRTRRVRLPFAAAGALGLAVFALAPLPLLAGNRRRQCAFAACFLLLASLSISLVLHLREARYYPLSVLLAGSILALHLRYAFFATLGARGYGLGLTALLVLLFWTFYSGYFAFAALLAVHALLRARRPGPERARALAALLPLLASAALVSPLLVFFETFRVASEFASHLGASPGGYAENLATLGRHFLRHELLGPALLGRAAVVWSGAALRRRGARPGARESRRVASFLGSFALGYAALLCLNPLFYERYFVVLSPVVTLVFLLDAFTLLDEAPRLAAPARRGRVRAAVRAGLLGLAGAALAVRALELEGRVAELRVPYRGPLDFAIAWIREHYARPEELVIATNYSAHSYMYYLGSRVIVGLSLNDIAHERSLEPDLVIPRRGWRPGQAELRRFLQRGRYEPVHLPVEDRHFNNIPALSRTPSVPDPHRFRTPATRDPERQLVLYRRVADP